MSKTVDFSLCLTYRDFKPKNEKTRMVSRAGEEALRVQGGGGGTGIRRRPWLKGGRLPEDGQVQGARFSTSERDTAEPDGARRAESAPALEWVVLGLSEVACTLLWRQQAGAWRDPPLRVLPP